jgi:hypothetical protein
MMMLSPRPSLIIAPEFQSQMIAFSAVAGSSRWTCRITEPASTSMSGRVRTMMSTGTPDWCSHLSTRFPIPAMR